MAKAIGLASLLALAGCPPPPQTVDEFRVQVQRGSRMSGTYEVELSRGLRASLAQVSAPALRCYNAEVVHAPNHAAQDPGGRSIYRTSIRDPVNGRASIVMQVEHIPHPRGPGRYMPQGGFYQFLVDFEEHGGSTTMTVYGPNAFGYGDVFESFRVWAEDPTGRCPDLP